MKIATTTLLCSALLLSSTAAYAKDRVHVVNCTEQDFEFRTYNGDDHARDVPYKATPLDRYGITKVLSCLGKGKGRCWVQLQEKFTNHMGHVAFDDWVADEHWVQIMPSENGFHFWVTDSNPACYAGNE